MKYYYHLLERLMFFCVEMEWLFADVADWICKKIPTEFLERRRDAN